MSSTVKKTGSKLFIGVGIVFVISLAGTFLSYQRASDVQKSLAAVNRLAVPLGHHIAQIKSDAFLLNRELAIRPENSKPKTIPTWLEDQLNSDARILRSLIELSNQWPNEDVRVKWLDWIDQISASLDVVQTQNRRLRDTLARPTTGQSPLDDPQAIETIMKQAARTFIKDLGWGIEESGGFQRHGFRETENQMLDLQSWLKVLIASVSVLALLFLWFGERALRPLKDLALLARTISQRGLRKEDKQAWPEIPLTRNDEVSDLAREFNRMATALLEREKTVETQTHRLEDQNLQLKAITSLNTNILNSIQSAIVVTDLSGLITHANPKALALMGMALDEVLGRPYKEFVGLYPLYLKLPLFEELNDVVRLEPYMIGIRTYGPRVMPLKSSAMTGGQNAGAIFVLDDLTDTMDMEQRLRRSEHLAAVGRMSAQVAHEVRNPLHSIGLEAELATELAGHNTLHSPQLRQSLQSILTSVDKLEAITTNYLKLSKLSSGQKSSVDLSELLQRVLAEYASACAASRIQVDWSHAQPRQYVINGDPTLLEQALGNLMRNAIHACEDKISDGGTSPQIGWQIGETETNRTWIRIEDNGPGIPAEIRERIFEPFLTTKAKGTGLGLSFVKQVLDEHSAEINVGGEPGSGAVFEILFPGGK